MSPPSPQRRALVVLDEDVARRCAEITRDRPEWPCRSGCADCCRSLAAVPELSDGEGERLRDAVSALDAASRERIAIAAKARREAGDARPIVCPLLDEERGLCRVYEARPIACRTYGFYADRQGVLGCHRIAALAERDPDVVWGNHDGVEHALADLGTTRSLLDWLIGSAPRAE